MYSQIKLDNTFTSLRNDTRSRSRVTIFTGNMTVKVIINITVAPKFKSLVVMDVHGFIQGILADYYPSAAA